MTRKKRLDSEFDRLCLTQGWALKAVLAKWKLVAM